MTIHVTVETCQGVVEEVMAFLSEESALAAERKWLKQQGIKSQDARECKSDDGTSFSVMECDLKR